MMEPNSGTHTPAKYYTSSISSTRGDTSDMQYIPALLLVLVHLCAISSSASLSVEVVKMKSRVKRLSEQLVVKINNIEIPQTLKTNPSSEEHYGQSSVVMILNGYNDLISESLNGAPQVKSEMAALTGFISQSRAGHCSDRPKPLLPEALRELQSQKQYEVTISFTALFRTMEYLKNLLKNLDQLETCM